jgi:hypothetical protein
MKIQHVEISYVNQVWPAVEGFIAAALSHQDDYTLEQAKVYVSDGSWMLVVAVADSNEIKGAATVKFFNRPNHRVAFVVTMGGSLITGQNTYEQFSDLLKAFGATYIEGVGRESIARLWKRFGFIEKYRVVGAKL